MITPDQLLALLPEHLPAHLRRQRWSGAQERVVDSVDTVWHDVLRAEEPLLVWTVVRAHFADGGQQDYQLFLGARSDTPPPDFIHGKEREHVASVEGAVVYDALVDPDLAVEVLHLVAPGTEVGVRRPIVLEHSNSSVVFDETTILKVFRKVEPGANPDVELTRELAESGYAHVLPPLAELRRHDMDLAVLREFLVGATEGWQLACASVRDLLASGLPPDEAGADFAPDAERIGTLLAELHLAMAALWGAAPGQGARWAQEMAANLQEVAPTCGGCLPLDDIEARYAEVASLDDCGQEIRIHGDLHLAQLIKADAGWKVLDFEGEPARRRDDRFTTSSPLRDVAGMLRSLHYAAATGLAEWSDEVDEEAAALVDAWEERNRVALLTAYLETDGIDALLPAQPGARSLVLAAFELDKAVYEVGYEVAHRPDQVDIPLSGITRLLGAKAGA